MAVDPSIEEKPGRLRLAVDSSFLEFDVYEDGTLQRVRSLIEAGSVGERAGILHAFAQTLHRLCAERGGQVVSFEVAELDEWNRALLAAGFGVHRRKLFVERSLGDLKTETGPFGWMTLAEVGDVEMATALGRAAEGDPFEEGADHDSEREYRELLSYAGDHLDRTLWRIALIGEEPVGVVLAQPFGATGTLAYVGIFPEHRGIGLGRQIHRAGLALLRGAGVTTYKGSTDVRNAPMARVFERNGCSVKKIQVMFRAPPPQDERR